ncbi:inverted formin-2-like [Frankliniella occidentalis]|uniref:Inverted formin-2-like n=1 Tax=Frankliniella occidentalis TaxID=133901 RepID=A0A9C6WRI9_FRAOC|nr:inverted formin-2-like [Frankliniella occidentalis]
MPHVAVYRAPFQLGRPGRRSAMASESRYGLDYIVENPEYTQKLAAALDTPNALVKKQVFELLSALCVYNADGYARSLDALEHYKVGDDEVARRSEGKDNQEARCAMNFATF